MTMTTSFTRFLARWFQTPARPNRRTRLRLSPLEERTVPTTYTVTTISDSGAGSLRQAILDANTNSGADSINFDSTIWGQTIGLTGVDLDVTESLTITGPSAGMTVNRTSGSGRIFDINDGNSGSVSTITMTRLIISGGNTTTVGGGVYISGENVTLTHCTVTTNSASSNGGGIFASNGSLTINGASSITDNSTASNGGGIFSDNMTLLSLSTTLIDGNQTSDGDGAGVYIDSGSATINNSTISNNDAVGSGGGIAIDGTNTVLIKNSTLNDNSASSNGGGIYYPNDIDYDATYNIQNTTIWANTAGARGGGIFVNGQSSGATDLRLYNSTIASNTAKSTGSFCGGGIAFVSVTNNAAIVVDSTIVAQNVAIITGSATPGMDIGGERTLGVQGINGLIGIKDDGGWTLAITSGKYYGTTSAPQLPGFTGGLASNGGSTKTVAIDSKSDAYNHGNNSLSLTNDQRGGNRVEDGVADIGAYEYITPANPN